MSFYDAIRVGAAGASTGYEVERSLRFEDGDSPYLSRTPSSAGNRKTFTFSAWVKRSSFGRGVLLGVSTAVGSQENGIEFDGEIIRCYEYTGSFPFRLETTARYRDPSAWMHVVFALDTTQASSGNRAKLYVNGEQITDFSSNVQPSQNHDTAYFNTTTEHRIGQLAGSHNFDGYMAEINFIDGFQYDPSYFGETDPITGQWNPKKYVGSYGTNGFYLNFSDNSGTTATTMGKDSSGNGNNFTPNNFEVSTGVGNDSVPDTPTNNFPTLNPLYNPVNTTFGEGNLLMRGGDNFAASTFLLPKSGKWYAEFSKYNNGALQSISVTRANTAMTNYAGYLGLADNVEYVSNGEVGNRTRGSTSDAPAWTDDAGVVVAVAVDMDNGAVYFARNNTYINSGVPTSGSSKTGAIATDLLTDNNGDHVIAVHGYNGSNSYGMYANFGQQPFTYTPPTGYKVLSSANLPDPTILLPNKHFETVLYTGDGNATRTLSNVLEFQPDWLWTKSRNATYAHLLYDAVRGAGSLKSLSLGGGAATGAEGAALDNSTYGFLNSFDANGFSFTKGSAGTTFFNQSGINYVNWIWNAGDTDSATYTVKVVSDSGNKYRFNDFGTSAVTLDLAEGGTYTFDGSDSSMSGHPFVIGTAANGSEYSTGVTYQLDGASVTYSQYTSGYSSATTRKLIITVPASAPQLYYWCSIHSGMGGAINTNSTLGSSNFDGTLQATVKANPTAGFSIVTWTGNQTSGATLGHGLGVAPKTLFVKRRDGTSNWICPLFDEQKAGQLNTATQFTNSYYNVFFTSQPSSTLLTIGSNDDINRNTSTYVAYVFSEVAGYSKIGRYYGNGSSDGVFVFTGFKVALLLVKRMTGSGNGWTIIDNKRDVDNSVTQQLYPASNTSEASYDGVDFLANGFKVRQTNAWINGTTDYYYLAFAESPFKNSRAR